jgi:hypothetical protein
MSSLDQNFWQSYLFSSRLSTLSLSKIKPKPIDQPQINQFLTITVAAICLIPFFIVSCYCRKCSSAYSKIVLHAPIHTLIVQHLKLLTSCILNISKEIIPLIKMITNHTRPESPLRLPFVSTKFTQLRHELLIHYIFKFNAGS